ncbi:MAG: septum formation initiator family protein [Candidatus Paceibacterota bacterium]
MPLGREKGTFSTILYSRITIAVILAVSLFLMFSVYERYVIEREMAERREEVEAERAALIIRKAELEKKVEYLSNEAGVEAEIRKHFDVAREGEQVVIIVDGESESTGEVQAASVQGAESKGGFWSHFFSW